MASTRSTPTKRRATPATAKETPRQALTALTRRAARIQIAAAVAATRAATTWGEAADRFAQTVGDELLRRVDGETDSTELIVRVSAATTSHLRELSALPRAAADHFDARLERAPLEAITSERRTS